MNEYGNFKPEDNQTRSPSLDELLVIWLSSSSYRTDKVTYTAIYIISVMRQTTTKVNLIYSNCIQLHWIPALLLDYIQSSRRYPGSDTVSNRFYIATHQKFRIVINQAQIHCPSSALHVSWFQRKAGAGRTQPAPAFTHQLSNRVNIAMRHADEDNKQCNVTSQQQEANLYELRTNMPLSPVRTPPDMAVT